MASKRQAGKLPSSSSGSGSNEMPAPFKPVGATSSLTPFLATLDKRKVYIVHVDRLPIDFKRRIFAVPVILNMAITAALLWRAWSIWPTYIDLILLAMGQQAPGKMIPAQEPWAKIVNAVVRRAAMLAFDYFCFTVVAGWPYTFFLELPGNPVQWRWTLGFRAAEIVVRKSRGWGRDDLMGSAGRPAGETAGAGMAVLKRGRDSPFFKTRVVPAVDKRWMAPRTGYMMMSRDWDLDFKAMLDGHALVAAPGPGSGPGSEETASGLASGSQPRSGAAMGMQDFQKAVLVYVEDDDAAADGHGPKSKSKSKSKGTGTGNESAGRWGIWRVWQDEEAEEAGIASGEAGSGSGSGAGAGAANVDEATRNKIVAFKSRLTALGKESLFFRWIEIVQYEGAQPGGFTTERQQRVLERVRLAFADAGLDFDAFVEQAGGLDALPGLTPEEHRAGPP